MSTLEALQRLDDGKFHRLCDEIIPRISTRYFPLTPHGVSSSGTSIKGQPDSFVGEAIASAKVAIAYSTQKRSWWGKLLDDVRKAKDACPVATELVWATSRDTERDGNPPSNWLTDAEAVCVPAKLTVLSGRRLSQLLDSDHQDLRFQYLDIAYSRLTYEGLVAGCRKRTDRATRDLQAFGRYDANAYVVRRADATLFELWEACGRASLASERPRLIPIVSDAGLGKTSLLCRFAESFSSGLPVLFVIARDMTWQTEDSIVRFVTQAAEGVLEPHARSGEEQSIARLLRQRWPLTIAIDGLDETHEPEQVRRALRYWLASPLGEESTLIVSSRPQFWSLCEDHIWGAWTPREYRRTAPERHSRSPLVTRGIGFSFPELLNEPELETAWTTKGRAASELASLGAQVRAELSHPFTLRAFLELSTALPADIPITRASILDRWITERLKTESIPMELLTPDVYRRSLMGLAERLRQASGWVPIEDLSDLPRYDPTRPPGRAIELLVAAGLIELNVSATEVRFGHESIADFFAGELDATRAVQEPEMAANELLQGTYSSVALRLEVVGHHVKPSTPPADFVELLARGDPARAILVMQGAPDAFDDGLRVLAVDSLATEISERFHARAAFAVDLLSRFRCVEARRALVARLHPAERCPPHLQGIAAIAIARAGAAEAADVTYQSRLFRSSEPYYFPDILHVLRSANVDVKEAIARFAEIDLSADQRSKQHVRAVQLLAHLGHPRVVEHLESAFDAGRELAEYENRALIVVGTETAARLFARSAEAAAVKITTLGWENGGRARSSMFDSIATVKSDIPHLLTLPFEERLEKWLSPMSDEPPDGSSSAELRSMAMVLARTSRSRKLAHHYVLAKDLHDRHFYEPVLDWLDPRDWLKWWQQGSSEREKSALVRSLPGVPTPAVEAALVDALRHRKLTWQAARYLGDNGTGLAKTGLREIVANIDPGDPFASTEAIRALGKLRDPDAVQALSHVARTCKPHVRDTALASLGLIGTRQSEAALVALLDDAERVAPVSGALVLHGSDSAVRAAMDLSKADSARGSRWLIRAINEVISGWGWRRGEYFSHIHDDFGAYLLENDPQFDGSDNWEYFRLLDRVDTPSIRAVLRLLAQREGSSSDAVLRAEDGLRASRLAYDELFERGDLWALPQLIKVCVAGDGPFGRYMAEKLLRFPHHDVRAAVRQELDKSPLLSIHVELDRLLGFFGGPTDFDSLRVDSKSHDDALANAADEALLRLEDPLRLPDNWSSLRA